MASSQTPEEADHPMVHSLKPQEEVQISEPDCTLCNTTKLSQMAKTVDNY